MRARPSSPVGLAVVVVATVVAGAGCRTPAPDAATGAATVVRAVDGDTIDVRIAGRTERVRLIGIDTPETKAPGRPVECFGPEASAHLAALLPPGSSVLVERDAEPRDRYGRLLVYLTRAGERVSVNEAMAAGGFADSLVIEPNVALTARIRAAVTDARQGRRGLWGACDDGTL